MSESKEPSPAPETTENQGTSTDDQSAAPTTHDFPIPHWVVSLIGHVFSAAIGLGLGYLILHWFKPVKFPMPW